MPLVLHIPYSHLWPGLRLHIDAQPHPVPKEPAGTDVVLLFGDGASSAATLGHDEAGRLILSVGAYRTTKGTSIAAKKWLIRIATEPDGEWTAHFASFREDR